MNGGSTDPWPSELFLHGLDLLDAGRGTEALAILTTALADCRASNHTEGTAYCLRWVGGAHALLGRPDAALECFLQVVILLADHPRTEVKTECELLVGLGLCNRDRYAEAEPYLRAAAQGLRLMAEDVPPGDEADDLTEAIAEADDALGDVLESVGDHTRALALYRSAAEGFERVGDLERTSGSRHCGAVMAMEAEDGAAAMAEFAALRAVSERLGRPSDSAYCSYMIGVIHGEDGEHARAEVELLRGRTGFDMLGDEIARAGCDDSLGETYQALGRIEEAIAKTVGAMAVFGRNELAEDHSRCMVRLLKLYPIHVMGLAETGRLEEIVEPMARLGEICDKADASEMVAELEMAVGVVRLGLGQCPEAVAHFGEARDIYRRIGEPSKALLAEVYAAGAGFYTGAIAASEEVLIRARAEFLRESNRRGFMQAQRMLGVAAVLRDAFEEGRDTLQEVYDFAVQTDDLELTIECSDALAEALIQHGDFDEAITLLTTASGAAESEHDWVSAAACRVRAAGAEFLRGRHASAEAILTESRVIFERAGADRPLLAATTLLGQVLVESGRFDDADEVLRSARELAGRSAHHSDRGVVDMATAMLCARRGDLLAAGDAYTKGEESFRRAGNELYAATCLQNRAMVAIMRGDTLEGRELTDIARGYYESQPALRWRLTTTYRNLAAAESRLGNYDSALSYLGRARAVCIEFGRFVEMAYCDYIAADATVRASDSGNLGEALDLGLPAIAFLDAQRFQFPDATSRVAWRSGVSGDYLSTLFDWVHRSGDPTLMADLIEITINSGTHSVTEAASADGPLFGSLETVLTAEVSKLSYAPDDRRDRAPSPAIGGAGVFVAGASLPMRPPPRLMMPDGHVALGVHLDSADQRYGAVVRPPMVRAW